MALVLEDVGGALRAVNRFELGAVLVPHAARLFLAEKGRFGTVAVAKSAHAGLRDDRLAVGREKRRAAALGAGAALELSSVGPDGGAVAGRGVVHVGHVLHLQLPVALVVVAVATGPEFDLARRRAIADLVDAHARLVQMIEQRHHLRVERGEHEAAVGLHPRQRHHAELRVLQRRLGKVLAHRHAGQLAVRPEGPAVIHAGEVLRVAALLLQHLRAAMPAAVEQHVHRAVGVAREHHRLARDRGAVVVARIGNQAFMPYIHPETAEDLLHLDFEHARVDIHRAMHPVLENHVAKVFVAVVAHASCSVITDDLLCPSSRAQRLSTPLPLAAS